MQGKIYFIVLNVLQNIMSVHENLLYFPGDTWSGNCVVICSKKHLSGNRVVAGEGLNSHTFCWDYVFT